MTSLLNTRLKRLTAAGLLTGLALALSLIDTSISALFSFLPGARLGLASAVSLLALYIMGFRWALLICFARCILGAVFAGQLTMFLFSFAGGLGSLGVMWLLKRYLPVISVSMAGGVTHNMMQLLVAGWVTTTPGIISYLPVLIVLGTLTGFLIGWLSALLLDRLRATQKLPDPPWTGASGAN